MGCNSFYLKDKVLRLIAVGRAGNYPLWFSLEEIDKNRVYAWMSTRVRQRVDGSMLGPFHRLWRVNLDFLHCLRPHDEVPWMDLHQGNTKKVKGCICRICTTRAATFSPWLPK